ncbi:MAG TPA: hypothetical protein VEV82_07725 [Actinomycetota bacterium]|nr:hypothetical protein [Actinomycetota bacterium]
MNAATRLSDKGRALERKIDTDLDEATINNVKATERIVAKDLSKLSDNTLSQYVLYKDYPKVARPLQSATIHYKFASEAMLEGNIEGASYQQAKATKLMHRAASAIRGMESVDAC